MCWGWQEPNESVPQVLCGLIGEGTAIRGGPGHVCHVKIVVGQRLEDICECRPITLAAEAGMDRLGEGGPTLHGVVGACLEAGLYRRGFGEVFARYLRGGAVPAGCGGPQVPCDGLEGGLGAARERCWPVRPRTSGGWLR